MRPPFRDEDGIIEFPDGYEPEAKALADGFLTYRITGVNQETGNRTAEICLTPKGIIEVATILYGEGHA